MMFASRFRQYLLVISGIAVFQSALIACDTTENNTSLAEDLYFQHFGNEIRDDKPWVIINNWYYELGTGKMKDMCAEAHMRAGYGDNVRPKVRLEWDLRILNFTNKKYESREIDVVIYTTNDKPPLPEQESWSITEGTREDCVFYLYPCAPRDRQYRLMRQVCGIRSLKNLYTSRYQYEENVSEDK